MKKGNFVFIGTLLNAGPALSCTVMGECLNDTDDGVQLLSCTLINPLRFMEFAGGTAEKFSTQVMVLPFPHVKIDGETICHPSEFHSYKISSDKAEIKIYEDALTRLKAASAGLAMPNGQNVPPNIKPAS